MVRISDFLSSELGFIIIIIIKNTLVQWQLFCPQMNTTNILQCRSDYNTTLSLFTLGSLKHQPFHVHLASVLVSLFSSEVFCKSNTIILKENDYISFPKLAHTYEKIANYGISAFYNGSLTQGIVDDIKAQGYLMLKFDSTHM